jgi:hypothetical protein
MTKAITQHHVLWKRNLEQFGVVLYEWFKSKFSEDVPISGPMVVEEAKELYTKVELTKECGFSIGWLAGFKT